MSLRVSPFYWYFLFNFIGRICCQISILCIIYICRVIKKSFANLSHFNEILWQSDLIICNLTYEFRLWAHNSGRFDKSPPTFMTKYQVNDCFIPKRSFILKYAPITVTSFLEISQNTWNVGVYFYKEYGHMIVFFFIFFLVVSQNP